MKKAILIISILAILIVLGGYFILPMFGGKSAPTATSTPTTTLPIAGGNGTTLPATGGGSATQQGGAGASMVVASRGGGTAIATLDFVHAQGTVADPSNRGVYYLATSANGKPYSISYDSTRQFFTISLDQEPIGVVRKQAEQFLLAALGISQGELCDVQYYVGTSVDVNSYYAGKNLGFSFCPQATALPQ